MIERMIARSLAELHDDEFEARTLNLERDLTRRATAACCFRLLAEGFGLHLVDLRRNS
jgi:hypothetical protein